MYTPEKFKETDIKKIKYLIDTYPLGLLICCNKGEPAVNHLPFIFEAEGPSKGKLIAHLSKVNDQYKLLSSGSTVSVVFSGPQGYISPSWYESAGVPTWNYASVQIKGKLKLVEAHDSLLKLLEKMTLQFESEYINPWLYQSNKKTSHLLDMIAGFEIEITTIEAKFKLSQNRSEEDRLNVIKKLSESKKYQALELSQWMKNYYS